MKRQMILAMLIGLLLSLIGCSSTPADDRIPADSAYNKELDFMISLGMKKEKVEEVFGSPYERFKDSFVDMYFGYDEGNQIFLVYNDHDVVISIQIDGTNWAIRDPGCYVNGKESGLSSDFMLSESKPNSCSYNAYYNHKTGQSIGENFNAKSYWHYVSVLNGIIDSAIISRAGEFDDFKPEPPRVAFKP